MTQKGYLVIKKLIADYKIDNIEFVCIGKDSKLDNDYSYEIEKLCIDNKISFIFRNTAESTGIKSDYHIAISWRWLLNLPNLIVLHDSILPKYRGFAPLVNMLINGEEYIGATAIYADKEFDKGDIIIQEKIKIIYPIKIGHAIELIGNLYGTMVVKIFDLIQANTGLKVIKQNENECSYSLWLDASDYFINWNLAAEEIKRKIDACGSPYEGAKSMLDENIVIINEAIVVEDIVIENRTNGKIMFIKSDFPIVVCGVGLLMITDATYEDRKQSILPLKKFRLKFS